MGELRQRPGRNQQPLNGATSKTAKAAIHASRELGPSLLGVVFMLSMIFGGCCSNVRDITIRGFALKEAIGDLLMKVTMVRFMPLNRSSSEYSNQHTHYPRYADRVCSFEPSSGEYAPN